MCDRTCGLQSDKTNLSPYSLSVFLLLTPITLHGQLLPFPTSIRSLHSLSSLENYHTLSQAIALVGSASLAL
jgi:hypothetical protein